MCTSTSVFFFATDARYSAVVVCGVSKHDASSHRHRVGREGCRRAAAGGASNRLTLPKPTGRQSSAPPHAFQLSTTARTAAG